MPESFGLMSETKATAVSAGECVLPLVGEDDYRFAVCEQQFRGWEMDGSKSV